MKIKKWLTKKIELPRWSYLLTTFSQIILILVIVYTFSSTINELEFMVYEYNSLVDDYNVVVEDYNILATMYENLLNGIYDCISIGGTIYDLEYTDRGIEVGCEIIPNITQVNETTIIIELPENVIIEDEQETVPLEESEKELIGL